MEKFAIVVAGGSGSRMNSATPKQFALLGGKPVLWYSVEAFYKAYDEIHVIVVIPQTMEEYWFSLKKDYPIFNKTWMVFGGEQRYHSVKNALELVPDEVLVGVHDAARPFLDVNFIRNVYFLAEQKGSCVPAISPHDSVRMADDTDLLKPFPRNKVWLIQTPQVFYSSPLKKAYQASFQEQFTDDASIWEFAGNKVEFCEGSPFNLKITIPSDFTIAEALIMARQKTQESISS